MQLQLPSKKKCNELGIKLVMYSSCAEGIECSVFIVLTFEHFPAPSWTRWVNMEGHVIISNQCAGMQMLW